MPRTMTSQDLTGVIQVHKAAFPGFFMTQMGDEFLRFYYQFVLDYPGQVALVETDDQNRIRGFVVGFFKPADFYQQFSAQKPRLMGIMIKAMLRNPMLVPRVVTNVLRVSQKMEPAGDVELSSIGVNQGGKGVGKSLLKAFLETAYGRGGQKVYLTTDAINNDGVNAFYQKNQFELVSSYLSGQRKMNLYIHRGGAS